LQVSKALLKSLAYKTHTHTRHKNTHVYMAIMTMRSNNTA